MKDAKQQEFSSLGDLSKLVIVPLPQLPSLADLSVEDLEVRAQKIQDAAEKQIQPWVRTTLPKLKKVDSASRVAQELAEKMPDIADARKNLKALLSDEMEAYRRATWVELLRFEFSGTLKSREEVEALLERLAKEGRLIEDSKGSLRAYGKTYAVAQDSFFGEPEVREVSGVLAALLWRVSKEERKSREDKAQELRDQGEITLRKLFGGTPGECAAHIPPGLVERNGRSFWSNGGTLLVKSDGERIFPVQAVGAFEEGIQDAVRFRVHLRRRDLERNTPPFVDGVTAEEGQKVQLLYHLLWQARRAEEEKEKTEAERQEFAAEATVAANEFFSEQKPGTCLVALQGDWEVKSRDGKVDRRIPNLFFLITRQEQEGKKRLRIVKVPDHLGDFFAGCMEEYAEGDDKFGGVPWPLKAVLQAAWGRTSKGIEKASQAASGK